VLKGMIQKRREGDTEKKLIRDKILSELSK
jgi:hypothetical protein